MKRFFEILRKCALFDDISDENLIRMLKCLDAKYAGYEKNEVIASEGSPAQYIGIVLSGTVRLERIDYRGNRSIAASIGASELFAESFACANIEKIPFDIVAAEKTEIISIDCKKIIYTCSNACDFHSKLIFNLLRIVAAKNIFLNQKAEITSGRTTREKLMTYLYMQAKKNGSDSFIVPFDRQTLADFLEVDRSGLSNEISKLRAEGVIESEKSWFKLL